MHPFMNSPREGVYDRATAAALARGAAAATGMSRHAALGAGAGVRRCQVVRDERTDTLAFAAANETEVFVVFRGTQGFAELDDGLGLRIADCGLRIAKGMEGPRGVLAGAGGGVGGAGGVLDTDGGGAEATIFFCGHSLGGALAMLAAGRWEARSGAGNSAAICGSLPRAATWVYSFRPAAGGQCRAWARWYDRQLRATVLPSRPRGGCGGAGAVAARNVSAMRGRRFSTTRGAWSMWIGRGGRRRQATRRGFGGNGGAGRWRCWGTIGWGLMWKC